MWPVSSEHQVWESVQSFLVQPPLEDGAGGDISLSPIVESYRGLQP